MSLHDFFYELAEKALNTVGMVPPASNPSTRATDETKSVGSPEVDWALDTRPSRNLTDAEALAKARWHLRAINTAQRLQWDFERLAPTVFGVEEQS